MDVTDATFETAVLERSTQVPIVMDLWATWCGPCRTLGPIIEKVVAETGGRVELAKVDVDANPRIAQTFQVQSIPAVYAISDRKVVDSFVGALPEPAVRQWVSQLLGPPSEVEALVAAGDEGSLRKALDAEPANEAAIIALAGVLVAGDGAGDGREEGGEDARGARAEEALALLARVPETAETRRLAAQARVGGFLAGGADVEATLDGLLERVKDDEAARQQFVDLLEVLGPDDRRTPAYRRQLTARLF